MANFSARFSYQCACGQNPQHGDLTITKSHAKLAIQFLDRAWTEEHNRLGCTPAKDALKLTNKKGPVERP